MGRIDEYDIFLKNSIWPSSFNPSHHIGHIPENANNWERDTMPLIYDNVVGIENILNIHIETINRFF